MKLTHFPIKIKLFVLFFLIPTLSLIAYYFLATTLFQKDKLAYVLEAQLNDTQSLKSKINYGIENLHHTLENIFYGYNPKTKDLGNQSKRIFNTHPHLMALYLFEFKNGSTLLSPILIRENFLPEAETPKFVEKLKNSDLKSPILLSEYSLLSLPTSLPVQNLTLNQDSQIIVLLKDHFLNQYFELQGFSYNYLINSDGQVLLRSDRSPLIVSFSNWKFWTNIKLNNIQNYSGESQSPENNNFLLTFSLIKPSLALVSMPPPNKVLSGANQLIVKSGLFLLGLAAVTMILSTLFSAPISSSIKALIHATRQIGKGDYNLTEFKKSNDELGELAESISTMAKDIANFVDEQQVKIRMQKELETAQIVQNTLYPQEPNLKSPQFLLSGYYESASECSGDWWYYKNFGPITYFFIGDATGHGVGSALATSAVRSVVEFLDENSLPPPSQVMKDLNHVVCGLSKGNMYMTFLIGKINSNTGELTYCNASHEPPLLFPNWGQKITRKNVKALLGEPQSRLGENRETIYCDHQVRLSKTDLLFLYTDGLTELLNSQQKMWAERSVIKVILKNTTTNPQQLVSIMSRNYKNYQGEAELEDDVTFIACRII